MLPHPIALEEVKPGWTGNCPWPSIGREAPPPTGNDKTSLRLWVLEQAFGSALQVLTPRSGRVLAIPERLGRKTLDTHLYVDIAGPAAQEPLTSLLGTNSGFGLLGSLPRKS